MEKPKKNKNRDARGRFVKGNTLSEGRPAGSLNKSSRAIREFYTQIILDNREVILRDFQRLRPKDRLKLLTDLSKFVLPNLKSVEITNNSFDELSDTDLEKIIQKLENQTSN